MRIMSRWDDVKLDLHEDTVNEGEQGHIKILVVDDEEDIHRVTDMILAGFVFEHKSIEILHAYSGKETLEVLEQNKDIQVIFLDVMMETPTSGLDIIKKIRHELKLKLVRIILRTGQPGQAPEESVIIDYDINDYHLKTDLTAKRLKTTLIASLKNYRDLFGIEQHKQGLEKIIQSSSRLFQNNQLDGFLESILEELSNFQVDYPDLMYIRKEVNDGFLTVKDENSNRIVAATGDYQKYIGKKLEAIDEMKDIVFAIADTLPDTDNIIPMSNGILVKSIGKSNTSNYIYIDGDQNTYDYDLIRLFMNSFSIALDNFVLNNLLNTTQREIIIALAETVESHFEETGSHIRRIANMMYKFATHTGFSFSECEVIKLASTMHDLGKIAIPDSILKKPAKLTSEEFEIMKTHTLYGYKILSKSDLDILKVAADIAYQHHERFDGKGYPKGLKGKEISMAGRMMAICDVFDAMTHKRVYKDAMNIEVAVEYLNSNKGLHFDASLVDIFLDNISDITNEIEA